MSLLVPNAPKRITRPRDELDEYLSSDLEASFTSSMSLNSPPLSPVGSRNNNDDDLTAHVPQHLPIRSPVPMDISPAPATHGVAPRSRSFGREIVNTVTNDILARNLLKATPDKPVIKVTASTTSTPASVGTTSGKSGKLQRAALPTHWMQPSPTPSVEMMEVDSPLPPPKRVFDDPSSQQGSRKRRSTEPEPEQPSEGDATHLSDLDAAPSSSPSNRKTRKFQRFASSGVVFPLPVVKSINRPQQGKNPRRPTLSALLPAATMPDLERPNSFSAYPIIEGEGLLKNPLAAPPPARRAFSAMISNPIGLPEISLSSSDESFTNSSPAADYAKRNGQRVLRRRDGREEFRPKNGASAAQAAMIPIEHTGAPMPAFGSEAHGKVLPCTAVREDGLMRIETETLADLINGKYDNKIGSFHVVDCRFDYEFNGGHVENATNVGSTAAIEEMLLTPNGFLPEASSSGDGKNDKVILIFHCEFSLHRAPTIAKHLRAKDRGMNNHVYPKVHYPDMYILSGGYCKFFQEYPELCEPRAYVTMEDPAHSKRCDADLGNFRKGKWNRTRSYTYGDVPDANRRMRPSSLGAQPAAPPHRNTAPSGGGVGSLFAAANAARTRRVPNGCEDALATLTEHDNDHDLEGEADTSGSGLGHITDGSPCPPSTAVLGGNKRLSATRMMKMPTIRAF